MVREALQRIRSTVVRNSKIILKEVGGIGKAVSELLAGEVESLAASGHVTKTGDAPGFHIGRE